MKPAMNRPTNSIPANTRRLLLAACLSLAAPAYAGAQALPAEPDAPANPAALAPDAGVAVPLKRVTLYSSGVGFFEHHGPVPEGDVLQLRFREQQINDILKSLQVFGADTATVSFDTAEPLNQRLGKFGIDVSGDTSLPAILKQLRGEVVTAHAPMPIKGRILDVSEQLSVASRGEGVAVPDHVMTLVTADGMQQVSLRQVQQLKLADEQLSQELNKALLTLAGARNRDARPVDIRLGGETDANASLAYLVEAPVWKTSYRLGVDDDGSARLQGWAVVENTTGSDWDDIVLTLASGRPVSFVQDLYTPLYLDRPVVEPKLFASLRPAEYDLGRGKQRADLREAQSERLEEASRDRAPADEAEGYAASPGFDKAQRGTRYDKARQVAAAALSGSRGELFQYTVKQGVDLPRGRSAMLPILTAEVKVDRLSVYDQATHATHPMRGVRLSNSEKLKLPAGPMTVLDDGAYAGDATLPFTGPDDERLLTYAVDLEMQVTPSQSQQSRLVKGIIAQGVLKLDYTADLTRTYAVVNESADERRLLIAHPINRGWTLKTPEKPAETTADHYRFAVKAEASDQTELKVVETRTYQQQFRLLDSNINQLTAWSNTGELDKKLREALTKVAALKNEEQQLRQQAEDQRQQTRAITQEQGRIRENMGRVDRDSQLYERYLTKLSQQEDRLEALQTKAFELDEKADAKRDELSAYLSDLTLE